MPTITFQPSGQVLKSHKGLERVADIDPRLTRSHYFDNRLLTAEDLNRDQLYLDGRLREVGRALGYGVMRGLELALNTLEGELRIAPGVAVSHDGRVLELTKSLSLDLNDRAKISELNRGRYRRFNRALYAVVIRYVEMGTDIAEVFPTDLGEKKDVQFDVISEGIQVGLVPLRLSLMQQNPLHIRAHLMQQLYRDNTAEGAIDDNAVALGVLAIDNDRPQWLDAELLRQPLRSRAQDGDWQKDLYRRYQMLFKDVMEDRAESSLNSDFAATDYFRWLPPVGALPKASIDPVEGRQSFFPEHYRVSVAPVRRSELSLIQEESMALPPFDLQLDEPMDVVVLAPLNDSDYGNLAARLERPANFSKGKPAGMDLLRLRLFPRQPVHALDLDRNTWQAIWDIVQEGDLSFVRRPTRSAETNISGIVLNVPVQQAPFPTDTIPTDTIPSDTVPAPNPSDTDLLADESEIFLKRVNLENLARQRGGDSSASQDALEQMQAEFSNDAALTQGVLNILLRVEREYDDLIWSTVLTLARSDNVNSFHEALVSSQDEGEPTARVIAEIGARFDLASALVARWADRANDT